MRPVPWDRASLIAELRDRVWLHLSPSATAHDIALDAAALLGLRFDEAAALGQLHFLLHPAISSFLDAAPDLLRRPTSDMTQNVEITHDRIRGPVDWQATRRRRLVTREPHFVTRPPRRDVDIQPNRAVALLLNEIRDQARSLVGGWAGSHEAGLSAQITAIGTRAGFLASHRTLSEVTPASLSSRDAAALRSPRLRRRFSAALDAHAVHQRLISHVDRAAIRDSVERYGFAASSDGTLFEIAVLFALRLQLQVAGFALEPLRLFRGRLRFGGRRGDEQIMGFYQETPSSWRDSSQYRAAQLAHGFAAVHDLRPDVTLRLERAGEPTRWLAIEAKTTEGSVGVPRLARRALTDLLAYRAAFAPVLDDQPMWGLGVVWGEGLAAAEHPVGVCTRDCIGEALDRFLA
ncbi:hypothetical protein EV383_1767 [Pseudonocardia sediminis]|uniref:Uncharacterized protein n=1 Tax=Pseudonocardia sediminis TaxID=1397368 RepID=A0A4Q7UXP2_PSEST|nr:hypothetical protein [Pseudonocardia sediminis]RZT84909.1 hypothetical protein EV383_1767 [Pseudonocardia sediminis]